MEHLQDGDVAQAPLGCTRAGGQLIDSEVGQVGDMILRLSACVGLHRQRPGGSDFVFAVAYSRDCRLLKAAKRTCRGGSARTASTSKYPAADQCQTVARLATAAAGPLLKHHLLHVLLAWTEGRGSRRGARAIVIGKPNGMKVKSGHT